MNIQFVLRNVHGSMVDCSDFIVQSDNLDLDHSNMDELMLWLRTQILSPGDEIQIRIANYS